MADPMSIAALVSSLLPTLTGEKEKERDYFAEQDYNRALEQWGMGQAQDVLGAQTREQQLAYLQGNLPTYTPYAYSPPDEAAYRRLSELGIESLRDYGREALAGQSEEMAARGLGASSIGIGAGQRMQERTERQLAGLEAEYAQQATQRKMAYEQLMAQESARATQAASERAQLLAGYQGPSGEEITAAYEPWKPKKTEKEYGIGDYLKLGTGVLGFGTGLKMAKRFGEKGYFGKKKGWG